MEFTWGHVFLLAEKMFSLNDRQLAEKLKVHHSTIHRHRSGKSRRFEPQVDIYEAIFAPPGNAPATLQDYLYKLIVSLDSDAFPADFRCPKYNFYRRSIEYLLKMAAESGMNTKSQIKQPKQMKKTDGAVDDIALETRTQEIPLPAKREATISDMLPISINPIVANTGIGAENTQPSYISKPRYMIDDFNKSIEDYSVSTEELDPQLMQIWSSVCIKNEFIQSFERCKIADFIAVDPLNFGDAMDERFFGKDRNGLDYIKSTLQFVNHMETAIEYVPIYDETEEIHMDISGYTTTLHKYLDFLRKHSTNSNLLGLSFVLVPDEYDDKGDLERKIKNIVKAYNPNMRKSEIK